MPKSLLDAHLVGTILLCYSIFNIAIAQNNSGVDVLTLKNGDSYNGTVAHETFTLQTYYGIIQVPYVAMSLLQLGTQDTIQTHQGETFFGRLLDKEFTLLRVLGPALPIITTDIKDISFTTRPTRQPTFKAPDSIETENGMRFFGEILDTDFMLKGSDSVQLINRKDIHLIDIASFSEGQEHLCQITLNNGQVLYGEINNSHFQLKTRFGQTLQAPIGEISTLAFATNNNHTNLHFNHRRRLSPGNIIQDYLTDETAAPEMLILRGGRFIRGQKQGDRDELPAATNPGPFAIGIYEISFTQYDKFCDETNRKKPDDGGFGRGNRPVINVSWKDAKAYTEWLSRMTRKTYRLPTDAEWEYAARGATSTIYWWGNELQTGKANCSGCGSIWDGEKTAPVGRFLPNPYGLHDTAGNVFEWVEDCFHNDFLKAPEDGSAHVIPDCGQRVIRGGAWSFPPAEIRSANRWRDIPSRHSDDTGFRVVRELD